MADSRNEEVHEEPRTREADSRESEMREMPWKPAPLTPKPNPRPGLEFRYVRASMRGEADNINVSQALRDGWEPVLSSDYPELMIVSDRNSQYPDNVLIGGLLLCSRPSEIGEKVREYAQREASQQMEAVDRNYFREQDAKMPMLKPERSTRITFGDG